MTIATRGPVFRPGDPGYDTERAGFQLEAQHRPDLIVGATCAQDVVEAVRFAGDAGWPVAVQATGHGLSVGATSGVLINTSRMAGVRIDADSRTAWIEAGVRWADVIEPAARHGLAPLSGSAPHVGAVSYTLGGGIGLLARQFGYAADRVREIDIVTADGRPRRVTPDSEPDLFWALRGGRDGFGVVTGMRVDLVPLDRLYGGGLIFAADLVADVLTAWREWTATVPDELTSSVGLVPFPDFDGVPAPLRGRYVAHVRIAYAGAAAGGERLVAPLRAIGPRLVDSLGELPFTAAGAIYNDPTFPHAYYGNNVLLSELDCSVPGAVLDRVGPDAPIPCVVELRHLGGALADEPAVPNAVGHRDAAYLLRVISMLGPADADTAHAVHQRLYDDVNRWTVGRTRNFIYGRAATADHIRECYELADHQRLAELRKAYDMSGD